MNREQTSRRKNENFYVTGKMRNIGGKASILGKTDNGSAMNPTRRSIMACLLALPFTRAYAAPGIVKLRIASDGDEMAFKPDRLTCPAGADVRVAFHHAGEIINDPHDWVLLKPGTETAFLADADRQTDDTVAVPPADRDMVLAATPLCAKGKTVSVTFTAPAPGNYPFVCSVAGHGESMHGILTVTA
jgi:azurin